MSGGWRMLFRFPIALVLSFVCFAVPAWADFQAGMDANNRGDYATALREWRPLAERGVDVEADPAGGVMPKGNRPGHRRFGNVRRLPSGRYQASYLGLDGLRKRLGELGVEGDLADDGRTVAG